MARTLIRLAGAFLVWLALVPRGLVAQSLGEELVADARDGAVDQFEFASALLIASGTTDKADLHRHRQTYEAKSETVLAVCRSYEQPRLQLAALHQALHQQILRGSYRASATDIRETLYSGDYNCLSAAALYWDLAKALGLDLQIWLMPGHVELRSPHLASSIAPSSKTWLTETLSIDPERAPAVHPLRAITPVALLGKFYYNRGVQMLERREFAAGIACLEQALALDAHDADAQENLASGLNNWAADHLKAGDYAAALPLIQRGLQLVPDHAPLRANRTLLENLTAP